MKEVDVLASFARQMSLADRVIARKKRSDSSRVLYRERHIITPHWWNGTHTWIALTRFLLHVSRYISREKNQLHAYRRNLIFELVENHIIFFFFKRKRSLSTILQFLFREFREKEKFRDFKNSKLFIDIERFPTVFSINACKVFSYLSHFFFCSGL